MYILNLPDYVPLKRELSEILQDCSNPDWNGYDSKPIDRVSVQYVCQFLEKLPDDISYPELAAEPNGDLTMVWRKRGYHLVIGIDNTGLITWGGTSSHGHLYGDAKFNSDIPKELTDLLFYVEGIHKN